MNAAGATPHDARLLPGAALAVLACVALAVGVDAAGVLMALAALGALGLVLAASGRARDVGVAVAVAAALAGVVAAGAALRGDGAGPVAHAALAHGTTVHLEGVVEEPPRPTVADRFSGEPRWRMVVRVGVISTPTGAPEAANARVVVVTGSPVAGQGERISVDGRLTPAGSARDLATVWDARVRAPATASAVLVRASPATALLAPPGLSRVWDGVRAHARQNAAVLPPAVRDLALGMAMGDDAAMDQAQAGAMRRTGLVHLTAVSGSHFAVLVMALRWCGRAIRLPRWAHGPLVGVVAALFTALVLPQPAVLRAFSAALCVAWGVSAGRPARAIPALSSGVLVLLAWEPALAATLGFQLSVLAVLSLAWWAPHLAVALERVVVPRLAHALAIPGAATVATGPLLLATMGGVGLYTVPANLVAGVAAAPVTLAGVLAVAVGPWWDAAARTLWWVAGTAAWPVVWAGSAFDAAPGSWWQPTPARLGMAVAAVSVGGALAVLATTSRRVRGWGRGAVVLGAVLTLGAGPVLTATPVARIADWDVVACDVGQGDAMLLRSGPHSAVVIDVGPRDGGGGGGVHGGGRGGGAPVLACLDRHGVTRIDLLVLTHPHEDHDGALPDVLARVPVSEAWVGPLADAAGESARLRGAGVPVREVGMGEEARVGEVTLQVWGPPASGRAWEPNDASVVVWAQVNGVSVLALGDVELAGQHALATALGGPVVVDVVKVAHHGSAVQDAALAARITARVAVVSVGQGNSYGHPAAATLELYGTRASLVARTDQCGDVVIAAGLHSGALRVASQCPPPVAG